MINSGLSLLRALNILAEQTESSRSRAFSVEVRNDVEAGNSLSGGDGQAPEGLPAAHGQHVQGRRGRRLPRPRAAADRGELRGRGQAARQDQVGDDLPGRRGRASPSSRRSSCCSSSSRCSPRCSSTLGGTLPAPTQFLVDLSHIDEVSSCPLLIIWLDRRSPSCGSGSSTRRRCAASSTRSS